MELLTIILISSVTNIIILLVILFFFRKKKKPQNYLQERAENLLLMINQTILSLHKKIQKRDLNITQMIYEKENIEKSNKLQIEEKIKEQKEVIETNIHNLDTLKEFKLELQKILELKEITNEDEIEKKLDNIASFIRNLVIY